MNSQIQTTKDQNNLQPLFGPKNLEPEKAKNIQEIRDKTTEFFGEIENTPIEGATPLNPEKFKTDEIKNEGNHQSTHDKETQITQENTEFNLPSAIANDVEAKFNEIQTAAKSNKFVPGVQSSLIKQPAIKGNPITPIKPTPKPVILNASKIATTLQNVFGEELELSKQEIEMLNKSFEDSKTVIQEQKIWPDLEQLLERKKAETKPNLDIKETEEIIITALAA